MEKPDWYSPTAIGATIHKMCENKTCGRIFDTHEPFRLYCTLRCRDQAARGRRKIKERAQHEGHDPRLGALQKEKEAQLREEAIEATNNPETTFDIEVRTLFNAVVAGKTFLMDIPQSPGVKEAVNKMLIGHATSGNDSPQAAPTSSYIVQDEGSESVLKDLGFLKGGTATEYVPEVPLTDEEKAKDL